MKLEILNLVFSYSSRQVLSGIQMQALCGEILGIVGPNGSGKSTLLKCIDNLLKPKSGTILLNSKEISNLSPIETARRLAYLPQSTGLTFPVTVFDVVLMGRHPYSDWGSSQEDMMRANEAISRLGLVEIAMRDFHKLSGGQQQKVLIARALVQEAKVLLLDEPTAHLDISLQLEVIEILTSIVREKQVILIMTLHDLNLAARCANKLVLLHRGEVYAAGTPRQVLSHENIAQVYGVEASVELYNGVPLIVPLRRKTTVN